MKAATKRAILRWFHLTLAIPLLGYIYSPVSEIEQYAPLTRYLFVPLLLLSGYWMYAGILFALLAVAAWLTTFHLAGFGPALLSQILLLIARKLWLVIRARRTKAIQS